MTDGAAGWVNAHTHIYSGLVPLGMPAPKPAPQSFVEILERVWWRLDRALDEDLLRASARYYVAESLLAGTTGLIDHHESPNEIEGSLDILADACEELGMRAVLCYGVSERNFGEWEAERGLAECRRFAQSNGRSLVRGTVGVHASFTVSDDTLRQAGELARELSTVVHVHVAEDGADVHDARSRGYPDPLERLLALDALPAGSVLAHGVHLKEVAVRHAEDHDLWFVQNPRSNRANRVGYPRALSITERVAIGTDGFPSDMIDEAEQLVIDAAGNGEDPLTAALRLERGHHLLAQLFGGEPPTAEARGGSLVVAGREVVRNGELLTADANEIRAEARTAAARLWRRMQELEDA